MSKPNAGGVCFGLQTCTFFFASTTVNCFSDEKRSKFFSGLHDCFPLLAEMYVKLSLVNKGKTLQKKRTESQVSDTHVQFNETHVFDLPLKHVDKTSLVLSLKETQRGKWISGDDPTVGKCVLNARTEDIVASGHWKEMFLNSRNPVVKWQFFR